MVFWPSRHPDFWPSGLLAIRPSDHPAIWPSGHPDFWPSDHQVNWPSGHPTIQSSDHPVIRPSGYLVIQTSGHLIIRSFGHLTIQSCDHPVFWPSVSMPQKCPYWGIFGLPYCRLHQSQISNVLPALAVAPHRFSKAAIWSLMMRFCPAFPAFTHTR